MAPHGPAAFSASWPISGARRPRCAQSLLLSSPALPGHRPMLDQARPNRTRIVAAVSIALTREAGKNAALRRALAHSLPQVECVDLPCVETVQGPESKELAPALSSRTWAWVIVTSPEAASVLADAWVAAGRPRLRIAAVGTATSKALTGAGLDVEFVPGKATGKSLVEEFEEAKLDSSGAEAHVLYPSSLLASSVIPEGLARKGFRVTRLNTYSTVEAKWTEVEASKAEGIDIVSFAAPSAVKSWVSKAGVGADVRVACIGETSASAAVTAGFAETNVFFPTKPGLAGWVSAVGNAIQDQAP